MLQRDFLCRGYWQWFPMLLCIMAVGCGSQEGPDVVAVTGTVTYKDQPVSNIFLTFEPTQGRPSWGVTDENGKYTLNYTKNQDGAVVGTHKVWFKYKPKSPAEEMAMMQGGGSVPENLQAILEKYGDRNAAVLEYEVKGDNAKQVIDINLE